MRLHQTRQIDRPLSEVFNFTADFANAEMWDPGVASSHRVGEIDSGVGARYDLMVVFGSRQMPMTYQVTEWDQDSRVVLEGKGETLEAVDVIEFEARAGGTSVVYTADLKFTNWMRFIVPFMSPVLRRVGERALDGLVEALER